MTLFLKSFNRTTKIKIFTIAFIINAFFFPKILCEKFVLGPRRVGFFSNFFGVLNYLAWMEKEEDEFMVYWDKKSLYYQKEGFNGVTHNVWEYYFEPIFDDVVYQEGDSICRKFSPSPGNEFIFYRISLYYREKAKKLIDKYIRIKPIVLKKINYFYDTYMSNKRTVGVYWRGTDKCKERRKVSQEEILLEAKKNADSKMQFLIVSDEMSFIQKAKEILSEDKIIHYDCFRSSDGTPIHKGVYSRAQAGEDVLVEVMLLSRCDKLIFTYSNVSAGVLYFNPQLDSIPVGVPYL